MLKTKVDIDTPFGYLEGVPAEFSVETEEYPAEPTSWGEGRGTERSAHAQFLQLSLGGLTLRENEAVAAFGLEAISAWEEQVELEVLEA
jgi:hypothetical protein